MLWYLKNIYLDDVSCLDFEQRNPGEEKGAKNVKLSGTIHTKKKKQPVPICSVPELSSNFEA